MAALLAILAEVWGFFKPLLSALVGNQYFWIIAGTVIITLMITSKGCGCRRDKPVRTQTISCEITDVLDGATLTARAGLLGRKERTLRLAGIEAPGLSEPFGADSQASLKALAGDKVSVLIEEGRAIGSGDISGLVSRGGKLLNLEQVKAGLAACNSDAPKEWMAAQTAAKKQNLGMWAGDKKEHWWNVPLGRSNEKILEAIQ
jgi:endonuclease YncB( thermonuclease family)